MASRADTEALLQAYYSAFGRSDVDALLELLTDDVAHDVNQGGRETGRAAFRTFLERMNRAYRESISQLVVFATEDGTRGAAEFVVRGEYLATEDGLPEARGQRYVLPVGAFFEVRDGRIARVTTYYDLNEWLRQVRDA